MLNKIRVRLYNIYVRFYNFNVRRRNKKRLNNKTGRAV